MAIKKSDLYSSLWASCDELRGGIPERDLDALSDYWKVIPGVRNTLFESAGRAGYALLARVDEHLKKMGAVWNT